MPVIPLAYKFVLTAVMLMEANHCAKQLELPVRLPITEADVAVMVVPPKMMLWAGRMDTTSFSFSFTEPGQLRFITRLESGYQAHSTTKVQGQLRTSEFLPLLTSIPSTISTNDAYCLATNWLTKLEVDVARLERNHRVSTKQQALNGCGPIPIFNADWGEWAGLDGPVNKISMPVVSVMIAGDTKDLLSLRQKDISYSKRPVTLIKDLDKLLSIPDTEFLGYSPLERSNLVTRFTAVNYLTNAIEATGPKQPEGKKTNRGKDNTPAKWRN